MSIVNMMDLDYFIYSIWSIFIRTTICTNKNL